MFSLATLPSERKPMTRRDKLREELDGLEKLARDRKLPYVDYLCNLRKQNGDDVLHAMIVKHCAPARKIGELRLCRPSDEPASESGDPSRLHRAAVVQVQQQRRGYHRKLRRSGS